MKKKTQIFSMDITLAIVTFLIILISSIWITGYSSEKIDITERRNDLEFISKSALSALVETPGNPSGWDQLDEDDFDENNIYSLGLAMSYSENDLDVEEIGKSPGLTVKNYLVLDDAKIQRLKALESQKYNVYKRIMGVLGPEYEFQLKINLWNGSSYHVVYEIGMVPGSNATNLVRTDRFALLNSTWTDVVLNLWKECEGVSC